MQLFRDSKLAPGVFVPPPPRFPYGGNRFSRFAPNSALPLPPHWLHVPQACELPLPRYGTEPGTPYLYSWISSIPTPIYIAPPAVRAMPRPSHIPIPTTIILHPHPGEVPLPLLLLPRFLPFSQRSIQRVILAFSPPVGSMSRMHLPPMRFQ